MCFEGVSLTRWLLFSTGDGLGFFNRECESNSDTALDDDPILSNATLLSTCPKTVVFNPGLLAVFSSALEYFFVEVTTLQLIPEAVFTSVGTKSMYTNQPTSSSVRST